MEPSKEQLKADKAKRANVMKVVNRLLMQFSFSNIKTWNDVYKFTGFDDAYIAATYSPEQRAKSLTQPQLKEWCKQLTDDVEFNIKKQYEEVKAEPQLDNSSIRNGDSNLERKEGQVDNEDSKRESVVSKEGVGSLSKSTEVSTDETGYTNENNYGLSESAKETASLMFFQKKASAQILDKLVKEKKPAVLLIARTGAGKTYIQGAVKRRLLDIGFTKGKTFGHIENLSVTRTSVVEQSSRVFKSQFGIDTTSETEVINIEQLRSRAGEIWLKIYNTIENGEEVEKIEWKPLINPVVIDWDECHALKNEDSKQHKIAVAFSELKAETAQLFISATPFARVSEAKAFAIATKKDISDITGIPNTKLSAMTWQTYASHIAQGDPADYNEAAVERLMKDLEPYIVRVVGVRWQFNAINTVKIIDFEKPSASNDMTDAAVEYQNAWLKFLAKKAKLEESITENPRFQALVELGVFLAAAEYSKRYVFAERMYNDVMAGKAAVLAVKFKKTIIAVTRILNEKYGVPRDFISLIWGGGQTQLTAKQKLKAKFLANREAFEAAGVSEEDMMLDEVEERVLEDLPEHLRLGSQSKEERQREIDRFQSGRSLYAIYTYKAGGTGLSLHHTDEMCTDWNRSVPGFAEWYADIQRYNAKLPPNKQCKPGKVRKKKNGYAIEEDIKFIPTRPRKSTIGPTWSPFELIQGCGRSPRLTSLSDTEQEFLYYKGTVEEDQAFVVTHKLKCMSKVTSVNGSRENWQDLILNSGKSKELAKNFVEATADSETNEKQTDINLDPEEGE